MPENLLEVNCPIQLYFFIVVNGLNADSKNIVAKEAKLFRLLIRISNTTVPISLTFLAYQPFLTLQTSISSFIAKIFTTNN
jgi:energy-converting hydrogenase Eha subunit E